MDNIEKDLKNPDNTEENQDNYILNAQSENIKNLLEKDGRYVGTTVGVSMLPMIRSGKDVVVIAKKRERLKEYDVALYIRSDSAYILHRVLKVIDGGYIIRGDNCYSDEKVPEYAVIGYLEGYFKGEKYIDCATDKKYKKYYTRRIKFYKPRKFFVVCVRKIKSVIKAVLNKLFGRNKKEKTGR